MYRPGVVGAEYVELYNRSGSTMYDLTGWRLDGVGYTFPGGAVLGPGGYLVLVKDRMAFAEAWGGGVAVYDVFPGNLQADGETLTLLKPGAGGGAEEVVDRVRYEAGAPWPAGAAGGASLQLIDAGQDRSRVCNWSDGTGWRFFSYTGTPQNTRLYLYLDQPGDVYLDDFMLVSNAVAGVGHNYMTNGGFEKPLTNGWRLNGNASNATVLVSGVVHGGSNSLRMVIGSPAGGVGSTNSVQQNIPSPFSTVRSNVHTLSFWYLPTATTNVLTAYISDVFAPKVGLRQVVGTPGAANSVAGVLPALPPVWLNEVQPENTKTLTNGSGQYGSPWVELYNGGTNGVDLGGLYLTDSYTNLARWMFPTGAVIEAGGFKVVWVDGQTNQSTLGELHTSFRLAGTMGWWRWCGCGEGWGRCWTI